MRARDVIGRTIIGVKQVRIHSEEHGETYQDLRCLTLDNGTALLLTARDAGEHMAVVEGRVHKLQPPPQEG